MRIEDQVNRPVVGYEGLYEVSNTGIVKSIKRGGSPGKILKLNTDRGYLRAALCKNNKIKMVPVHRIVAFAFIPCIEGKVFINHKDGIRDNNNVENLEWCTRQENETHKKDVLGTSNRGNSNPNFKRGKGLMYPTFDQTIKLKSLGIPAWAIRLDWIGVMLPDFISVESKEYYIEGSKDGYNGFIIEYTEYAESGNDSFIRKLSKNEAEARAAMLIYLLENKFISAEEVNKRLAS